MKNKKAQMHIEVILSFILFISAVLIIFSFLNPLDDKVPEQINIDLIEKTIINQISEPVGIMSVITQDNKGCYVMPTGYEEDYGEDFTEFYEIGTRKYTLYFSESLSGNHPNYKETEFCLTEYDFGVYLQEDLIIYNKIQKLISDYDLNYKDLKKSLQLKNDFVIKFKQRDGTDIIALKLTNPKKIPSSIDIIAKEFPIRVIKDNGEIQEMILNIQTW